MLKQATQVKFYVGTDFASDHHRLTEREVMVAHLATTRLLSSAYGGWSLFAGQGGWVDGKGQPINEANRIYESTCFDGQYRKGSIAQTALELRVKLQKLFQQETVLLTLTPILAVV